ncbi:MAG: tetratricopeptide repeat protein, partial [Armatimonadetes bacterium]|nr:tetratricopeptide repeat protein [Armatimonadota bacterium]
MKPFLMEDHSEALKIWADHGIRGSLVIHVDAHPDFSEEGLDEQVLDKAQSLSPSPILWESLQADLKGAWFGIHCGNYLAVAMKMGMIARCVWVLPKGLFPDFSFQAVLSQLSLWVDVPLEDLNRFALKEGRWEGSLWGIPLILCDSEHLPEISAPYLLDIDVDYFIGEDSRIWTPPSEVLSRLCGNKGPEILTIAYSVSGGYTPLEHRFIGDLLLEHVLSPSPPLDRAESLIIKGDGARAEGRLKEARALYEEAARTGKFLPAALYKAGLAFTSEEEPEKAREAFEKSEELDPRFRPDPLDEALVRYRLKDFDNALHWFEKAETPTTGKVCYLMKALIAEEKREWREALELFSKIVVEDPREKTALLLMKARISEENGALAFAQDCYEQACALQPLSPAAHWGLGRCLSARFRAPEGIPLLRKALRLAKPTLQSLAIRTSLSRAYRDAGMTALAQGEERRVLE